jgi:HAD superfamily hydrolase (TIGR01509 family)
MIGSMLRALIFDFNGVIVDDEPLHLALFQQVLAEEGVSLSEHDYYTRYLAFDDRDCFTAALDHAGRAPSSNLVPRLVARKAAYYQTRIRQEGFPIFPGAADLINAARQAGLTLGLVSGALRNEIEGALTQIGLRSAFKSLVAAEDVQYGKPDPEGYKKVLTLLNSQPPLPSRLIHPHEVVVIEDAPAGIEAAQGAGLATLAVGHTYPLDKLSGADATVATLAEIDIARVRSVLEG